MSRKEVLEAACTLVARARYLREQVAINQAEMAKMLVDELQVPQRDAMKANKYKILKQYLVDNGILASEGGESEFAVKVKIGDKELDAGAGFDASKEFTND
jgi:beta-N-acetylglucosaminidase